MEPLNEPESITRLRKIHSTRVSVNLDTVKAWLSILQHEPYRGPADIAANPGVSQWAVNRRKTRGLDKDLKKVLKEFTAKHGAPHFVAVPVDQLLVDLADLGHFVFATSEEREDANGVFWDPAQYMARIAAEVPLVHKSQMSLFPTEQTDDDIHVSLGFSKAVSGRNLLKAVTRIVKGSPDDEVLVRWLMRRHWGIRPQLTYPVIATVAKIAAIGRIDELDEVASIGGVPNADTAALLVEAWEFLAVGCEDATRGVDRITADAVADHIELGSVELDRAIGRVRNLHEGVASRLARELSQARNAGDPQMWRSAATEFARRAAESPTRWHPGVEDLNDGQILRMVSTAGIPTTEPDHKVESAVRKMISDAGLSSELSTSLLWHGVAFAAAGYAEQFEAALTLRKNGRGDWAEELNTLLKPAAAAAA